VPNSNWKIYAELVGLAAVVGSLVFVGYEIRQNTSQLRAEGSRSITESVNALNAGVYSDPDLATLILRGTNDLAALTPEERFQFDSYQFSRLNIAEFVLDLEQEGVSDLNFKYVEWVVREFNERPGLRAFIREYEEDYVGSDELLGRLLGSSAE
jgi:hypothetical protein